MTSYRVAHWDLCGYLFLPLPLTRYVVEREEQVVPLSQVRWQLDFHFLVEIWSSESKHLNHLSKVQSMKKMYPHLLWYVTAVYVSELNSGHEDLP